MALWEVSSGQLMEEAETQVCLTSRSPCFVDASQNCMAATLQTP